MNGPEAAALLLPVLCGLGLIGLAALVARTGWQQRHSRLFACLYLLSGINSLSHGLLSVVQTSSGPSTVADTFHAVSAYFPGTVPWLAVQVACTVLMLPLLFLFVLNFPRPMPWTVRHPRLQWLAFSVSILFGTVFLLAVAQRLPPQVPVHLVQESFNVLATAVILAATFALWRTRERSPSDIERRQAGYLLVGFMPAFAATGAITLLGHLFGPAALAYQLPLAYYISPPLELAAAAVTAFAILKYRLLDFELRVRGGMRYVVLTVLLGALVFAIEVYVGNFILQNQVFSFLGPYGSAGVAAVTGILLFKPLHKASNKVTDRLFPDAAAPKVDYERQRAGEIYRAQATHVLRDATVTDREMAFLRTLRDQLGLSAAEAQAIEEGVERRLGVDDARTGQAPPALPAEPPLRPA
ncbi:MAG TPA: hypothetical protein VHI93_05085 [Candidatus Thermoplasmatota archaeon]|nr:hypothetical protein [Candidatus Thermoplasmatota archaeon]